MKKKAATAWWDKLGKPQYGSEMVISSMGGINFFNNKSAAIKEMIRVARSGTKLLIVDETEKVARKYERVPFSGDFYSKRRETIMAPAVLVPQDMLEINVREVAKGICIALHSVNHN